MAPEIFLKAYAGATTEDFRMSEDAPKIDAKNPAGTKKENIPSYHSSNNSEKCSWRRFVEINR